MGQVKKGQKKLTLTRPVTSNAFFLSLFKEVTTSKPTAVALTLRRKKSIQISVSAILCLLLCVMLHMGNFESVPCAWVMLSARH